ncbi:hypothetical protein [Pseudomonas sp.]|uniref:hypothetical protein n=1 Tax=Pseudomonas sp. TaxID=306 RepID=UPI002911D3FA|nr:hypothetical protein [Pseudomonas sp.]MDU4255577.1 hypothetical protein [Pseudomonas sp.]
MRIGAIDTPADLLQLSPEHSPVMLDWLWVGLRARDSGDVTAPAGLRSPAKVEGRAWWDERLIQGRYLRTDERLLLIESVRDVIGGRVELVLTCAELVGEQAEYRPEGGAAVPCRVFITHSAPVFDDENKVTDYRILAELALIEVGRCQVDDQLLIGGQLYNMIDYAGSSDDGVVRGMYLEAVS